MECFYGKKEIILSLNVDWLADSAGSRHISFHGDWFKAFPIIEDEIRVQTGEDSKLILMVPLKF